MKSLIERKINQFLLSSSSYSFDDISDLLSLIREYLNLLDKEKYILSNEIKYLNKIINQDDISYINYQIENLFIQINYYNELIKDLEKRRNDYLLKLIRESENN